MKAPGASVQRRVISTAAGLLAAGILGATSHAQTPQMAAQQPALVLKQPSFKVQLINPAGTKTVVREAVTIELESVSSDRDQAVRDLLNSKGFVVDAKSIAAVRKLNPAIRADGTVPAGTQVTFLVPQFAAGQVDGGARAAFDMAVAAKYKVSVETVAARTTSQQTIIMPAVLYERQDDIALHRELVGRIETTAAMVEDRADKLTAKDLALSKYYLSQANAQAQMLTGLKDPKSVRTAGVVDLKRTVEPLDGMRIMMQTSGAPFEYRPVVVKVSSTPGAPSAEPLRVYTLPGGIIDQPSTYSIAELKSFLIALSFEKLTTPSRSMVGQGDMRVWVGPDHAYEAMARHVQQKAQIRFAAVMPSAVGAPERELEFTYPVDVVRP